jgi:hypothetical protein
MVECQSCSYKLGIADAFKWSCQLLAVPSPKYFNGNSAHRDLNAGELRALLVGERIGTHPCKEFTTPELDKIACCMVLLLRLRNSLLESNSTLTFKKVEYLFYYTLS